MADCEETLRELEAFLDGELSPDELVHVRLHLQDCLDCLQVYDFHFELKQVIRAKCREREVPPSLLVRVQACFGTDAARPGSGVVPPVAPGHVDPGPLL